MTKKINRDGLARALHKARSIAKPESKYNYPICPPKILTGIAPKNITPPVMALDYAPVNPYAGNFWSYGATDVMVWAGFPGYPYLSQLMTRPEYRAFASALSTECTREWIEFTSKEDDDDKSADKIKQIQTEFERLNVRGVIETAIQHDSAFGRAQIFVDIQNANRDTPLILDPRTIKKGSLNRVTCVEPIWTTPVAYNALDPVAPDFYKPNGWWMLGQQVHASRLLTVVTRPLPDILKPAFNFSGMSLSQLAEPYVDNWLRTRQSVSDLVNNFSILTLSTAMDQVLQGDDVGDDLFKRVDLFNATRSNRGIFLLDKDREELGQINTPLSGLDALQSQAQEHMCVSKGTLIETNRGQIPIEEINVSDKVMTRNGYAPVAWAGVTGYSSRMIEIQTSISKLMVTGNHPIWSETKKDFVNAEIVNHSHFLKKSLAWENTGNPLPGEVVYGAIQKLGIFATLKLVVYYIGLFMKPMLAGFLKDLMFIIKMVMAQITDCLIFNYSLVPNINVNTNRAVFLKESVKNFPNHAVTALLNFLRSGRTELSIAHQNVNQKHGDNDILNIKSVAIISLDCDMPVYNLKVKEGYLPEFYANGILVHNCAVSRTPAMVLTGISPTGMNASSEGEMRVWNDWVRAQQNSFWRAPIDIILKTVQLSLFGEIDSDIGFDFVPLYQLSGKELAEVRRGDAETDQIYVTNSILDPQEVREKLAKDPESGYLGIDTTKVITPPADPSKEEPPDGLKEDDDDKPAQDHIVEEDGKYKLLSHKGKNLGVFNSREDAQKHEQQVNYFKSQ